MEEILQAGVLCAHKQQCLVTLLSDDIAKFYVSWTSHHLTHPRISVYGFDMSYKDQ